MSRNHYVMFGAAALAAILSASSMDAQQVCPDGMEPLKCTQAQLDAASKILGEFKHIEADIRAEIKALKSDLRGLSVRIVPGNEVDCDLIWDNPNSISIAACGADETMLAGGCSTSCFNQTHWNSMPATPNSWQCHHAPQVMTKDGRKLRALALCQKKLKD